MKYPVAVTVLALTLGAPPLSAQTIYPIDRAEILAGATFDFKVEFPGLVEPANIKATINGVDGDCLAQASLFAAFAELVGTYGEDAVAKFVEGLPGRVRNGEFSLALARQ